MRQTELKDNLLLIFFQMNLFSFLTSFTILSSADLSAEATGCLPFNLTTRDQYCKTFLLPEMN